MNDKSLLEKVIDNTPVLLVVLGLFLLLIGATGRWSNPPLQINDPIWRVSLATIGIIIAGIGVLLIWRERVATKSIKSETADYGIKILSPKVEQEVSEEIVVSGTYIKLPSNKNIKLFMKSPRSNEYWPVPNNVVFDENRKSWQGKVYISGEPGLRRIIIVAIVGESGLALCEYFERVGFVTKKWPGITRLTPDIDECDSVTIIRQESKLPRVRPKIASDRKSDSK